MKARAPGKLVISGSYAVLEGAPALVAAADRYVIADASRPAERTTPEVAAALELCGLGDAAPPWFDASALRERRRIDGVASDRKLGLGSSAAIVVASLAALELARGSLFGDRAACLACATSRNANEERGLAERVFAPALAAHRKAQGGGSGIDVAASSFGGVLRCELAHDRTLRHVHHRLPEGARIEVWSGDDETPTREMLARVRAFRDARPAEHRALFAELGTAAERAAAAAEIEPLIVALRTQREVFEKLGRAAGCSIVPPGLAEADAWAARQGAVVLPSGAGGSEVILWVGSQPSDPDTRAALAAARLRPLEVHLGCAGVHALSEAASPVSSPSPESELAS